MLAGEYCNREVAIIGRTDSIVKAAKLMREYHVGDVLVVESINGETVPVGIITDRDIVIGVIAENVDINALDVQDVASFNLITAPDDEDLMTTIKRMRHNGIRRIPVVNSADGLVGVLAVDDVIDVIKEQIADVGQIIAREQYREKQFRP